VPINAAIKSWQKVENSIGLKLFLTVSIGVIHTMHFPFPQHPYMAKSPHFDNSLPPFLIIVEKCFASFHVVGITLSKKRGTKRPSQSGAKTHHERGTTLQQSTESKSTRTKHIADSRITRL
jgi:hypothetical protein